MIYSYNVTLQRYRKLFEIDKKSSGGRVISKNKYCETLVSINTNKQYFLYKLLVGRVFQISLPLWSRCLFSAHAPLERSARAGESRVADSKRFSQASRKTVQKQSKFPKCWKFFHCILPPKETKTEKSPHTKTLVSHQPISLCRNNGRKSCSDFYLQKALSLGLKRVRKKQS